MLRQDDSTTQRQGAEGLPVTLFDVIAPDSDDDDAEATEDDWQWYRDLRDDVAQFLLFHVQEVRTSYVRRGRAGMPTATRRIMRAMARRISVDHFDGDPGIEEITQQIRQCARTFGLVVDSAEPGVRNGWPMPGRRDFDYIAALTIADEALHGRYPAAPRPR